MLRAYKYNTNLRSVLNDYDIRYHKFISENYGQGSCGHGLNPREIVFIVCTDEHLKAYWKHIPNSKKRKEMLSIQT